LTLKQQKGREHSRSLYAVKDILKGEIICEQNVKSIRPGFGMHPKYYKMILGKKAKSNIEKGTRMSFDLTDE
jgi:pseudaminic acid synthase